MSSNTENRARERKKQIPSIAIIIILTLIRICSCVRRCVCDCYYYYLLFYYFIIIRLAFYFILFYLKIDRLRSHHCWLYNVDIWIWMFVSARTHATKRTKWVNAYRLTHALLCVCCVCIFSYIFVCSPVYLYTVIAFIILNHINRWAARSLSLSLSRPSFASLFVG